MILQELRDKLAELTLAYEKGDQESSPLGDKAWAFRSRLRKGIRQSYRESLPRDQPFRTFTASAQWTKIQLLPAGTSYQGTINTSNYAQLYAFRFPCGYSVEARSFDEAMVAVEDWIEDCPQDRQPHDIAISDGEEVRAFDPPMLDREDWKEPISKKWGAGGTAWWFDPQDAPDA